MLVKYFESTDSVHIFLKKEANVMRTSNFNNINLFISKKDGSLVGYEIEEISSDSERLLSLTSLTSNQKEVVLEKIKN